MRVLQRSFVESFRQLFWLGSCLEIVSMSNNRPFAFIQHWGCYPDETMIVVGTKKIEDFVYFFKKLKVKAALAKDYLTWMKNNGGIGSDGDNGSFSCVDSDNGRCTVLYLKEWPKNTSWLNYQTLIHELHHAVNYILVRYRGMENEWEAQAYAQEQMFQQIRRKLDNNEKCEKIFLKKYAKSRNH